VARVPCPTREDLPEAQRPIYDRMQRERGVPAGNIFLALANVPHLLDPIMTMAGALRFAAEVTRTGEVEDATWTGLRQYFDVRQSMEIQLTAAWYNCVIRILLPLRIEHEEWFVRK
jgi:hypothetical protein